MIWSKEVLEVIVDLDYINCIFKYYYFTDQLGKTHILMFFPCNSLACLNFKLVLKRGSHAFLSASLEVAYTGKEKNMEN